MAAELFNQGRIIWSGSRDDKGYREYKLVNIVRADPLDGPSVVRQTPGLPVVGSLWNVGNDSDLIAFCTPQMTIKWYKPPPSGGPHRFWRVEQTFTTKPYEQDLPSESLDNPLLEPQKLSGNFVKYMQQATRDKDGNAIESSSHETLEGPDVEFDFNRPVVRIEQNVMSLGLASFAHRIDTVNSAPLWGLAARTIKLSNVSWERKLYGGGIRYYTRVFDFDIDFSTFDRVVPDRGYMALGRIKPGSDPPTWEIPAGWVNTNPLHFSRCIDADGQPTGKVYLDGAGSRTTSTVPTAINIQYYPESNFLLLGIPVSLLL